MPFRPDPFLRRFERLRKLRQRPLIGYLTAIASVAAATALRLGLSGILEGVPFITFYPAVALTTAVMVAAGLLGCAVPAMRALRIRPIEALRTD